MLYFVKRTKWWDHFDDPYYSTSEEEVRVFGSRTAAVWACNLDNGGWDCKVTKAAVYASELVDGEYRPVEPPLMVVEG